MPEVCRFWGLIIRFYPDEGVHEHDPHFHIWQNKAAIAAVDIRSGRVMAGDLRGLSQKKRKMLTEWTFEHQAELMDNWNRARNGVSLVGIPPPSGTSP